MYIENIVKTLCLQTNDIWFDEWVVLNSEISKLQEGVYGVFIIFTNSKNEIDSSCQASLLSDFKDLLDDFKFDFSSINSEIGPDNRIVLSFVILNHAENVEIVDILNTLNIDNNDNLHIKSLSDGKFKIFLNLSDNEVKSAIGKLSNNGFSDYNIVKKNDGEVLLSFIVPFNGSETPDDTPMKRGKTIDDYLNILGIEKMKLWDYNWIISNFTIKNIDDSKYSINVTFKSNAHPTINLDPINLINQLFEKYKYTDNIMVKKAITNLVNVIFIVEIEQ